MAFPKTSSELAAAGYVYDGDGFCRGCKEPIEWWITPAGAKIPMDVKRLGGTIGSDVRESHWATCTSAEQFRLRQKTRGV
jgi:hypothetical protein